MLKSRLETPGWPSMTLLRANRAPRLALQHDTSPRVGPPLALEGGKWGEFWDFLEKRQNSPHLLEKLASHRKVGPTENRKADGFRRYSPIATMAVVPFDRGVNAYAQSFSWSDMERLDNIHYRITQQVTLDDHPVHVTVELNSTNHRCDITFALNRRNYSMTLFEPWRGPQRRHNFLVRFHNHYQDLDADKFGAFDHLGETVIAAASQQRNCILRCVWDVISCIGQLMAGQGRSVLDYAVWYREQPQPVDISYSVMVTRLACHCIVHSNLLAGSAQYQRQEFVSTTPV